MEKMLSLILCTFLSFCGLECISDADNNNNKTGETKKMAELLFEERFEDTNFGSRGWTGGLGESRKFFTEHDSVLGRNVSYARWTGSKTGLPDGSLTTVYRSLPSGKVANGITFHVLVKTDNMIEQSGGAHHHAYFLRFFTYEAGGNVGNTNGEFVLDGSTLNGSYGEYTWPHNQYDPRGCFYMQNQSGGLGERQVIGSHPTPQRYLKDDTWFEVAVFVDTDDGGSNGSMIVQYREYGTATWHSAIRHVGVRLSGASGQRARIQNVGFGPYFHSRTNGREARSYGGLMRAYVGNAIADGTIGSAPIDDGNGGGNGGNGGTPGGDNPPVISAIKAVTTTTGARITWTTDTKSNSVVDYGDTANRGIIVRGNEDTTEHVVDIPGLAPASRYFYRMSSRDAAGRTTLVEENQQFTTKEVVVEVPPSTFDPQITNPSVGHVLVYDGRYWVNADLDEIMEKKFAALLKRTEHTLT